MTRLIQTSISLSLLLLVGAALLVSGCRKKEHVLATVNGRKIEQEEFDAYLKLKRIAAKDEKRRDSALDEYLEREALTDVIEREKVLDSVLIEAELREFKKQMVISRYFEKFLDEKVTDQAVKNYYDQHSKDYESRKVHVAHILIRAHRSMSEAERKAKLTAAQDVYAQLDAGADFAEVAKEHSEDRVSARKGGDLGWIKEGGIDPQFSKRAFSAKPGSISQPFETAFGFHILRVSELPKTVKKPFRLVQGEIRHRLRSEAKDAEVKRLKDLMKVEKKQPYKLKAPSSSQSAAPVGSQRQPSDAKRSSPPLPSARVERR